jgi:hypothetical protein
MDPGFLEIDAEHQHDNSISSISFKFEGELNKNRLHWWIGEARAWSSFPFSFMDQVLRETMQNLGADLFRPGLRVS